MDFGNLTHLRLALDFVHDATLGRRHTIHHFGDQGKLRDWDLLQLPVQLFHLVPAEWLFELLELLRLDRAAPYV